MVDLNTCPPTPPPGERSKIKTFMGRTPAIGMLKSKLMTVFGNSNELLNGISNKLTLSINSSESEYCDDDEEPPNFDESIDYMDIDFESRRVKARRAHEEIISGRYRHPNLMPRSKQTAADRSPSCTKPTGRSSSSPANSSSSSSRSPTRPSAPPAAVATNRSSTTRSNSIESRHSGGYGRAGRAVAGARRSELDIQRDRSRIREAAAATANTEGAAPQIDIRPPVEDDASSMPIKAAATAANGDTATTAPSTSANSTRPQPQPPLPPPPPTQHMTSNSSTLTSLRDDPELQVSPSMESTDWRHFIRSESQNSVPSWASSISLDCRAVDEPVKDFMERFVAQLLNDSVAVSQALKSEFAAMVRLEMGRQWFARFLFEQKARATRLAESSFYSLVQFLAIVLFECNECEDYAPASIVMHLCFTFYHEIDVPGCDPYREYMFTFMRQQPIWQSLRFWNAAMFEAVQSERETRLTRRAKSQERRDKRKPPVESAPTVPDAANQAAGDESSTSSSHHSNADDTGSSGSRTKHAADDQPATATATAMPDAHMVDDIVFRQLGTFTSNMHALGVRKDLNMEFLKKQAATWMLSKDKFKVIKENIQRMHHETDLWGAKES